MGSFHFVPQTEVFLYKCASVNHHEEAGGPWRQRTEERLYVCVCCCLHMKKCALVTGSVSTSVCLCSSEIRGTLWAV